MRICVLVVHIGVLPVCVLQLLCAAILCFNPLKVLCVGQAGRLRVSAQGQLRVG